MYVSKTGVSFLILSTVVLAVSCEKPIIWEENFDYAPNCIAVPPNVSIWTADTGRGPNNDGWGNGELQTYTEDLNNVRVDNGTLFLTALKTSDNAGFTSGRIHSDKKLLFKYATITMKARTPNVDRGLWPAFWTLGHKFSTDGWPSAGEINVMEVGQGLGSSMGLANKRVVSGLHWQENSEYRTNASSVDYGADVNDDYHYYTLDWTKNYISTYIDDTQVFTKAIDNTSCLNCTAFHDYHYMILNLAVGGGFTAGSSSSSSAGCGSSSSSGMECGDLLTVNNITAPMPAEFQIDWIRFYNNSETEILTPENQEFLDAGDSSGNASVVDDGSSQGGNVVLEPSPAVPNQPTPSVPTEGGADAGEQVDISPAAPPTSDAEGNIILFPRRTRYPIFARPRPTAPSAPATLPSSPTTYTSSKGKAGNGGKGSSSQSGKGSSKSSKSGKGSTAYSSTESALNTSSAKLVQGGYFISSILVVSMTLLLVAAYQ